ncbi:hypothetical protein DMN91_008133 [Ooceraea biroi]|uniref:Peptidase A2 domain-containing protein n=1 Tax=Ooceraea biroi TaxID=2015173 RepID=A0A3L8DGY5_OOCBI|nr:hypothetical protein DMN91_008133 [Ooceraea biroi]
MLPVKSEDASSSAGSAKSTRSLHARKQEKSDTKRNRCVLCHKDHFVMLCEDYKNKSAQDRKQLVDVNGLCFNCLGRHKLSDYASKKVCSACGSRHHSSLHDACREESSKTSLVTRKGPVKSTVVLLATARVRVADRYGDWHQARALVDSGSETSIVSEELSQTLKLPRSASSVTIFGVGGSKAAVSKGRITLTISPRFPGPSLAISALILPRLTAYAGGFKVNAKDWLHLRGLELADPDFHKSDSVDIILRANIYACIIVNGLQRGDVTQPVAQNTSLGWLLTGAVDSSDPPPYLSPLGPCQGSFSFRCRIEEDLNNIVRRFWEQEEVPSAAPSLTNEERECEEHYARTHFRQADGRYVVRLPLVSSQLLDFSSTRRVAERLLRQMESRFERDGRFHSRYVEFLQQYQDLGHMTRVSVAGSDLERVCYLPHHGVLRESSLSTKLRVVFNGSSSLPSGTSLNQLLHAGPSLLPALFDILLQWRRYRYVVVTDVEKMYRQIVVHPEDRDLQRILWRFSPDEEIQEFQLNTVTYGLASAPFLAIRTVCQLAEDEGHRFPLGAEALRRKIYMDDVMAGASTLAGAREVVHQLDSICKAGGFPLKKWSANDATILEDLPVEDRLQQERWWQPGEKTYEIARKMEKEAIYVSSSEAEGQLKKLSQPVDKLQ